MEKDTFNSEDTSTHTPPVMQFGSTGVDSLNVQATVAVLICFFVITVGFVKFGNDIQNQPDDIVSTVFEISSGEEMISLLKENSLWDINMGDGVSPLLLNSFRTGAGPIP